MGEDDGVGLRVFLLSRAVTLGDFGGTARPTCTLARRVLLRVQLPGTLARTNLAADVGMMSQKDTPGVRMSVYL